VALVSKESRDKSQVVANRCDRGSANYSNIARLLVKVRQAKARDINNCITYSLERRKEKAEGEGKIALYALISISSALEVYLNKIALVSSK
jgi:hypothetical protein